MGATAESDSRLLGKAREGEEGSFLALYQRYRIPLYRFAWRLSGSPSLAEDVVQECFLALLRGAAYDGDKGSLRGYLFGIARHAAFRRVRLDGRESEEPEDAETTDASPLENVLRLERGEAVARAVAGLPPLQREALILFEYEQLSLEEIAEASGVETGAVKARLHRARETLRRRLAPLFAPRQERRCP